MKSMSILLPLLLAVAVIAALAWPGVAKDIAHRAHDALFNSMARNGLVLGMAEIDSRQKDILDAGGLIDHTQHGTPRCLVFTTPAAAAWAQNDTFASGLKIPKGSRLLPNGMVSHGAFGSSVTMDIGLRRFSDHSTEIDNDGLLDGGDVAAAGVKALQAVLVASGVSSPLAYDAEPFCTLLSANPTDDAQATVYIWYLPPG